MAAQEFTWLTLLLENLHQPVTKPMSLYCDNLSAIKLAKNPVFYARTKHIEVHYHHIREKVLQEDIILTPVKTEDQVADIFTKGLSYSIFFKHQEALGMTRRSMLNESQC